ncbi:hypothetical protein NDU88_005125 [Pleurodeles waltl]|uniref:Uncharacterized protein n=1 Tax=Pleurodeles waltl TaxID=8319 RepID=A0AAV7NUF5_PLEWA|nr:hypothetical protein NDU88_005125 [Pleurodeles waltl]
MAPSTSTVIEKVSTLVPYVNQRSVKKRIEAGSGAGARFGTQTKQLDTCESGALCESCRRALSWHSCGARSVWKDGRRPARAVVGRGEGGHRRGSIRYSKTALM